MFSTSPIRLATVAKRGGLTATKNVIVITGIQLLLY